MDAIDALWIDASKGLDLIGAGAVSFLNNKVQRKMSCCVSLTTLWSNRRRTSLTHQDSKLIHYGYIAVLHSVAFLYLTYLLFYSDVHAFYLV